MYYSIVDAHYTYLNLLRVDPVGVPLASTPTILSGWGFYPLARRTGVRWQSRCCPASTPSILTGWGSYPLTRRAGLPWLWIHSTRILSERIYIWITITQVLHLHCICRTVCFTQRIISYCMYCHSHKTPYTMCHTCVLHHCFHTTDTKHHTPCVTVVSSTTALMLLTHWTKNTWP